MSKTNGQTIKQLRQKANYHFKQYYKLITTKPKQGIGNKWRLDATYHYNKRIRIENEIFNILNGDQ